MRGFTDVVIATVIILVGILVAYQVYTELSKQLANVTGLWAVGKTLMGIVVPVSFILAAIILLRRRGYL